MLQTTLTNSSWEIVKLQITGGDAMGIAQSDEVVLRDLKYMLE